MMAKNTIWRSFLICAVLAFTAATICYAQEQYNEKKKVSLNLNAIKKPQYKGFSLENKSTAKSFEIISKKDAMRYQTIFTLQTKGKMDLANEVIANLDNSILMGHVLYQRYLHPTAYTSTFTELENWLKSYPDHPGAQHIYDLAKRKNPDAQLRKPKVATIIPRVEKPEKFKAKTYIPKIRRNDVEDQKIQQLSQKIKSNIYAGELETAYKMLKGDTLSSLMDDVEFDRLKAKIAAAYYYNGNIDKAMTMASQADRRSDTKAPLAGWISGLCMWRKGNYEEAATYFERTGSSPYASEWLASAGSFWAARSYKKTGETKKAAKWFDKARKHPKTFYGLAATQALNLKHDLIWERPVFEKNDFDRIMKYPAGQRAMALAAANQHHLAQKELLFFPDKSAENLKALLSYALYAKLPAVSLRLGSYNESIKTDYAYYPQMDMLENYAKGNRNLALYYAIIRQESQFIDHAHNASGASGLMQILPSTAAFVTGEEIFKDERASNQLLLSPDINLNIGIKYINYLLERPIVEGNIFKLLVAYNAGPGKLNQWIKNMPEVTDPLLFIESIPSGETRAYVERVVANYWIYKMQMNQPTPTLDALATQNLETFKTASR